MAVLIQSLKLLFLFLTTGITIYYFITNYRLGYKYYMFFIILSVLLGFTRPIFLEEIIIPLIIPLGIYTYFKKFNTLRVSYISLFVLFYGIFITLITKDSSFIGFDSFFIYGLILLSFSNYLFGGHKQTVYAYTLLWLMVLAKVIWIIANTGTDIFQLSDISAGGGRLFEFTSGIENPSGSVILDPNYLGFTTGIGSLLSFLFLFYRKGLFKYFRYKFIKKSWFLVIVSIIGMIELWISLRGISRGVMLSLIIAVLTFFILNKKFKVFAITSILLIILFFLFDDLINLFLLRFSEDKDGSGRLELWGAAWNIMLDEGRVLFGFGLNYPWWKTWNFGHLYVSTHNSWLTLLLNVGLIGIGMLIVLIIKSIIKNFKANSTIAKIRLIMLAYLIVSSFTIEPMINSLGWILLAISTTYEINNVSFKSNIWKRRRGL